MKANHSHAYYLAVMMFKVKLQNNPEEVLDAVLRIFRYSILTASKPGPQPGKY
jgi:hypothetical protein